ncbi:retrovirus-related pol polyprotein from transposon TNT 1-94 [Tanacetum coccineum]
MVHMLCKPKSFYDEKNKVAIGYKNPLCLTRAKQVQSALYNGNEIVKTNHAPPVVLDSEDTLEIAEITRKRMLEKMKSPLCVENKVKIAPPDYSKENYLATFTPQRNLTPEQIFWSYDISKTVKTVTKPLSALTVYPPNTPAKLVPRVLPTKSQVKVNLYTLTQRFTEFEKTCKKRITPTGVTEWEIGFEQTKRCYLTEVIPFFKTLKQHFEGVQTALYKEVNEMKEIFEEMEKEGDQNSVDKQYFEAEISKLQNENQQDVNNEMIESLNKLEVEYLNFQLKYQHLQENFGNNKSQTSQADPEFDSFFKINNLEAQLQENDNVIRNLKVQVSKMNERSCDTNSAKDVKALDSKNLELTNHVTALLEQNERFRAKIEKGQTALQGIAQLKSRVSCVTSDSVKPKVLAPGMYAIDVEPIPPRLKNNGNAHLDYINYLKESVETVREIVEEARIVKPLDNELNSACKYMKLSQELLEYVIGVNSSTEASRSKPRSNTKKNRILHAKSENKKKVEDHPRTNKSVWTKVNRVESSISSKRVVINLNSESVCKTCNKCLIFANHDMRVIEPLNFVNANPTVKNGLNKTKQVWKVKGKLSANCLNKAKQVVLWYLDSGCSKHMMGNRSKLKNFVKMFIGTVRFGNDHFVAIMGYGDYVIGDSVIFRVYYVEGLGHNIFSIGQFCDSDLEIAFRKHSCFVRDMDGVDLLKGSRSTNLYTITVDEMIKSSPICLLSRASKNKSWLWHRRLNHLNFGTINDLALKDLVRGLPRLKFEKDHICSACQLGKSKKYSHKPKSENTNMEVHICKV